MNIIWHNETRKLLELIPYEFNPRQITRKQAKLLGFNKYYSGKICPKGHSLGRYVSSGSCIKCIVLRFAEYVCQQCGITFESRVREKARKNIYCSKKCFGKSMAIIKICFNCGKEFYNWNNKYFCSMKCSGESKIGKCLSKEHKKALSIAKKGKQIKHFIENQKEINQKISDALMGKPQPWNRGEKHPNYKDGGKAQFARQKDMGRVEYKNWRRTVYKRDDYTCQDCGERGGNLCADHVKPYSLYPELRYDIRNGRTLCKECHKKTDTFGGNLKRYAEINLA